MRSALQVLNENNKVFESDARITECRNSGLSVRERCEANHLSAPVFGTGENATLRPEKNDQSGQREIANAHGGQYTRHKTLCRTRTRSGALASKMLITGNQTTSLVALATLQRFLHGCQG